MEDNDVVGRTQNPEKRERGSLSAYQHDTTAQGNYENDESHTNNKRKSFAGICTNFWNSLNFTAKFRD